MQEPDLPVVHLTLLEKSFPFTIEWRLEGTDEVVHTITVEGPGPLVVPPIAAVHGPCDLRMTFADGEVIESPAATRSRLSTDQLT
jgi:hypothetical protein